MPAPTPAQRSMKTLGSSRARFRRNSCFGREPEGARTTIQMTCVSVQAFISAARSEEQGPIDTGLYGNNFIRSHQPAVRSRGNVDLLVVEYNFLRTGSWGLLRRDRKSR